MLKLSFIVIKTGSKEVYLSGEVGSEKAPFVFINDEPSAHRALGQKMDMLMDTYPDSKFYVKTQRFEQTFSDEEMKEHIKSNFLT